MIKKAQLSIFFIISLLILTAGGLFFYLKNINPFNDNKVLFEKDSINNYITSCLEKTSKEGLFILGKQGGSISPKEFIGTENYKVSFLYQNNTNNVPQKNKVEEELRMYVQKEFMICLNNLNDFKRIGWEVKFEEPESKITINEEDVLVNLNFPIEILNKEEKIILDEFDYRSNIRLKYILDAANESVNSHILYPEWNDLTKLSEYNLEINIFPYKEKIIYSFSDEFSKIDGKPYIFNFAFDFS